MSDLVTLLFAASDADKDPEMKALLREAANTVGAQAMRLDACDAEIERRASLVENAAACLKPFADEAATHGPKIPDQMFIWDYEGPEGGKSSLRVADLRRAAAFMEARK